MWGIGMANENEPGQSTEEPLNTESFDQVSVEGDGPPHSEATHAVSALAGQQEEGSNRNDDEEESKYYIAKRACRKWMEPKYKSDNLHSVFFLYYLKH